jgi:hypothetical protein
MSIVLIGATSGSITLSEPAVAGTTTLNLPATSGTVVVGSAAVSATGQIPFSTDGASYTPTAKIVSGTAVATTSGTAIGFTGIPSWVKRITVLLNNVSTNGTSLVQVQIGSTTYTTSGYTSSTSTNGASGSSSTGFITTSNNGAADTRTGIMTIANLSGNLWVMGANIGLSSTNCSTSAGIVTLSGTLDRVQITTVNGTDTFDGGSINILYE